MLASPGRVPPRLRRWKLASVVLVMTTAVAVRLPSALTYSLWGDEIPSARAISQTHLHGLLTQVRLRESTPPAWYVFAWVVHRAGVPLQDLRLLSVALSAALAGLVVIVAARLMALWAATISGLVVALGLQFVVHGRELRAYTLLMFLVVLFALLLDGASVRADYKRLAALAVCVALGTLTHYFFFFTLVCGTLWVVTSASTRGVRRRLTVALAMGLLPFLAWLPAAVAQSTTGHTEWIGGFNFLKVAYLPSAFFADVGLLYHQAARPSHAFVQVTFRGAFLALVLASAVGLGRSSERGRLCAILGLGPFLVTVLAALFGAQILDVRNLLIIAPFVTIAVSHAISRLPPWYAFAAGGCACLLALGSWLQARAWAPLPYRELARALVADGWQSDDPIALYGAVTPFPRPTQYAPPALGWYLPGHPRLVVAPTAQAGCPNLYVIRTTDSAPRFLSAKTTIVVGSTQVARLAPNVQLAAQVQLTHAHFLRARRHPSCEHGATPPAPPRIEHRAAGRLCPRRLAAAVPRRRRT